jgi:hypothetical protein
MQWLSLWLPDPVRPRISAATRAVAVGPLTTLCNLGPNLKLGLRF